VSSLGCGGDARGIKPSELGGVLQDAHYREQDYTDDEEGQCHDGSGVASQVHMGNSLSGPPKVDQPK
jgi:hypothetical protein